MSAYPLRLENFLQSRKENTTERLNAEYRNALATVLFRHNKREQAYAEWDALMRECPDPGVRIVLQYAETLLFANDVYKTIAVLEQGLKRYPESQELLYALIPAYLYTGNLEKSLKTCLQLPDGFEKDQCLIDLLCMGGEYELAYTLGSKWMKKISPEVLKQKEIRPFRRNYLSTLIFLEKTGELKKEAEAYLLLYPDDAAILNGVGYVLTDQNMDLDLAEKYLVRARKLQPDDGAIADSLAWLYYRQGKIDAAKKEMFQALVLLDSDITAEVMEHAGDILAAGKDPDAAEYYWSTALTLLPENHKAELDRKERLLKKLDRKEPQK